MLLAKRPQLSRLRGRYYIKSELERVTLTRVARLSGFDLAITSSLQTRAGDYPCKARLAIEMEDWVGHATRVLGIDNSPCAYLEHIAGTFRQSPSENTTELDEFLDMVKYFNVANEAGIPGGNGHQLKPIQGFIDEIVRRRGGTDEQQSATDDVLCMIGTWLCMDSYFRKKTGQRPIERVGASVEDPKVAVNCTLGELLDRCPAVPKVGGLPPQMDASPPNLPSTPQPGHDGPATDEGGNREKALAPAHVNECAFEPSSTLKKSR